MLQSWEEMNNHRQQRLLLPRELVFHPWFKAILWQLQLSLLMEAQLTADYLSQLLKNLFISLFLHLFTCLFREYIKNTSCTSAWCYILKFKDKLVHKAFLARPKLVKERLRNRTIPKKLMLWDMIITNQLNFWKLRTRWGRRHIIRISTWMIRVFLFKIIKARKNC